MDDPVINQLINNTVISEVDIQNTREYLEKFPKKLKYWIKLALKNDEKQSWKVAWVIEKSIGSNDILLKPYLTKIINKLEQLSYSHQRILLKLLLNYNLTKKQQGLLFGASETIWRNVNCKSGTRYYALMCLFSISNNYPELKKEIYNLLDNYHLKSLSPGIKRTIIIKKKRNFY